MYQNSFKDSFNLQKLKRGDYMRLLIKNRGQGKTTQMIYTSEATGFLIVVETQARKNQIMEIAKKLNVVIEEPMTIDEIRKTKTRFRHPDIKVIIDEGYNIIERALNEYIGHDVVAVTLTDGLHWMYEKYKKFQLKEEN